MKNKKKAPLFWLIFVIAVILIVAVIVLLRHPWSNAQVPVTAENVMTVKISGFHDTQNTEDLEAQSDGLQICRIGTYTGTFVEQGTDTDCQKVLALVVHNTGKQMLEKAVVQQANAKFVVTYLPAGGICIVQECNGKTEKELNRTELPKVTELRYAEASDQPQMVEITGENNVITIRNISGEDIIGSVNVWYKTAYNGLYFGGVSYKAAVDDGVLKADSAAKVQTAHYQAEISEILIVTYAE